MQLTIIPRLKRFKSPLGRRRPLSPSNAKSIKSPSNTKRKFKSGGDNGDDRRIRPPPRHKTRARPPNGGVQSQTLFKKTLAELKINVPIASISHSIRRNSFRTKLVWIDDLHLIQNSLLHQDGGIQTILLKFSFEGRVANKFRGRVWKEQLQIRRA